MIVIIMSSNSELERKIHKYETKIKRGGNLRDETIYKNKLQGYKNQLNRLNKQGGNLFDNIKSQYTANLPEASVEKTNNAMYQRQQILDVINKDLQQSISQIEAALNNVGTTGPTKELVANSGNLVNNIYNLISIAEYNKNVAETYALTLKKIMELIKQKENPEATVETQQIDDVILKLISVAKQRDIDFMHQYEFKAENGSVEKMNVKGWNNNVGVEQKNSE